MDNRISIEAFGLMGCVYYVGLFSAVLKFVKRLGIRRFLTSLFTFGPILGLYLYHKHFAIHPIINFVGTGYVSIFLTFLTYGLSRSFVIWGLAGVILITSRYLLFWFGVNGGFWSPLVRWSGWFYQPWVTIFPYCIGGVIDFGPVLGQYVHRRVSVYFRSILWCPVPPGVLTYDEIENKFELNYQLLEGFYNVLLNTIPYQFSAVTSTPSYVYLPLPKNCNVPESGYLVPISTDSFRSYDLISEMSRFGILTPERLHEYFISIYF